MSAQTSPTRIPDPTTRYRRTGQRGVNTEMLSWMFMRASGALLVILIFGHLFVNLWLGLGVKGIDFAFVAGKWANPFWQVWDLLMLWLGLIHGGNGVRTIINDYARSSTPRLVLKGLLLVAVVVTIVLGTLVIFTFNPCPAGAEPSLLPAVCQG
ncbi:MULTISPECIES: succinate dehydrogenase hydrophobic membrane anchor subunit [Brachybacterium]|uniref:Succinate dehydrogenase hydrophobic membrane anchor subunit n=1 Tax=Brachybacterium rhamnosum TaxID=173361 RepID=A0ABW4Q3L9_9MICO|nr:MULTISPECIES: succinate dehydrogenase hydrophobic membrane anchor subunit [Brachybacterium]MCW1806103.1 succinate dehydrogenase hydrophobic membrane anchor subunit [Brachybacterium squillarum]QCR53572.1 succinate dehydrogenase [Brachybacterium sp. SGAir0954]